MKLSRKGFEKWLKAQRKDALFFGDTTSCALAKFTKKDVSWITLNDWYENGPNWAARFAARATGQFLSRDRALALLKEVSQ